MKKKTVFLVGADTGGHVVPVFALARELLKNNKYRVVVIGVGSRIEEKFYPSLTGVVYKKIIAGKFQFRGIANIWAVFKSIAGFFQSIGLLLKFRPKVVFLKGNYSTVPVVFAARIFRIPVLAHESDAIIGKSNRLVSKFAQTLFVSYPPKIYPNCPKNVEYSGPILRSEYSKTPSMKKNTIQEILILGGSQGAHNVNEMIFGSIRELASSYRLIHQTGQADIEKAREIKENLPNEIRKNYQPEVFVEDDFVAVANADLIISRASSSIFEYAAFNKAAILIPYPYASLNHQAVNADYFSTHGAAIVLDESQTSPTILYSTVVKILSSDKKMREIAENLRKSVKLGGEKVVGKEIIKYLEK